eukprot:4375527-Prymnesium_polylepis.1
MADVTEPRGAVGMRPPTSCTTADGAAASRGTPLAAAAGGSGETAASHSHGAGVDGTADLDGGGLRARTQDDPAEP